MKASDGGPRYVRRYWKRRPVRWAKPILRVLTRPGESAGRALFCESRHSSREVAERVAASFCTRQSVCCRCIAHQLLTESVNSGRRENRMNGGLAALWDTCPAIGRFHSVSAESDISSHLISSAITRNSPTETHTLEASVVLCASLRLTHFTPGASFVNCGSYKRPLPPTGFISVVNHWTRQRHQHHILIHSHIFHSLIPLTPKPTPMIANPNHHKFECLVYCAHDQMCVYRHTEGCKTSVSFRL
jgi:hypothetical protein